MKIDSEILSAFLVVLGILTVICFGVMSPYYEAKSFNECTGGNATYMTALFTELRVQECKKL